MAKSLSHGTVLGTKECTVLETSWREANGGRHIPASESLPWRPQHMDMSTLWNDHQEQHEVRSQSGLKRMRKTVLWMAEA